MSAAHTPMVVAAARVLCNRMADVCHFDYEDAWKEYGNDYLDDAKAALDAAGAPELLELLDLVVKSFDAYDNCNEIELTAALRGRAREAIAKVGGAA